MISQAFITGVFVTQNITTNIVALFVPVPKYITNLKVPLKRFLGYVRGTKGHGFPITGI